MNEKRIQTLAMMLKILEEMKDEQYRRQNPMYRALDRYMEARKAGMSVAEAEKESAKETESILAEIYEEAIERLAKDTPRELLETPKKVSANITFKESMKNLHENVQKVFSSPEVKEKFKNLAESAKKVSSTDITFLHSAEEAVDALKTNAEVERKNVEELIRDIHAEEVIHARSEEMERLMSGYHPSSIAIDSAIAFLEGNGYEVRKRKPIEPPKQIVDHGDIVQLLKYLASIGIKPTSSMGDQKSSKKGDTNG